ncbi:MAG: Veg family protein [Bacillota bacterium]|nr:Veg family protein [Bacillota bacterium]
MAGQKEMLQIRRVLEAHLGERVRVRANKGRRKFVEREGTLESTYSSLFVIRLKEGIEGRHVSYTYQDILTSEVELRLLDREGEQLLAPSNTI